MAYGLQRIADGRWQIDHGSWLSHHVNEFTIARLTIHGSAVHGSQPSLYVASSLHSLRILCVLCDTDKIFPGSTAHQLSHWPFTLAHYSSICHMPSAICYKLFAMHSPKTKKSLKGIIYAITVLLLSFRESRRQGSFHVFIGLEDGDRLTVFYTRTVGFHRTAGFSRTVDIKRAFWISGLVFTGTS